MLSGPDNSLISRLHCNIRRPFRMCNSKFLHLFIQFAETKNRNLYSSLIFWNKKKTQYLDQIDMFTRKNAKISLYSTKQNYKQTHIQVPISMSRHKTEVFVRHFTLDHRYKLYSVIPSWIYGDSHSRIKRWCISSCVLYAPQNLGVKMCIKVCYTKIITVFRNPR